MIIFENEDREFGSGQWHRFYDDRNRLPCVIHESDLRSAHCVARIARIARKNGDVVALCWVERDLAGKDYRLLAGVGSAAPIAEVADRGLSEYALAILARNRSRATLSYDRHVAGVEVSPKTKWNRSAVSRLAGIDIEGPIFLDNPAIVLRIDRALGLTIHKRHLQIARRRENQSHGRCSRTHGAL